MFCKYCGSQVADNVVVCTHCWMQIGRLTNETAKSDGNAIAIVGFVFSFFVALIGLICSAVGYGNAKKRGAPYGSLAMAGIIISTVALVAEIIYIFIVLALVLAEI